MTEDAVLAAMAVLIVVVPLAYVIVNEVKGRKGIR